MAKKAKKPNPFAKGGKDAKKEDMKKKSSKRKKKAAKA